MDEEAKRIMALSISKLYSLRTQRGGLRLHRSLQLSMTMRAARDIYHTAVLHRESGEEQVVPCVLDEPMDTSKDSTSKDSTSKDQVNEPRDNLEEDKENQGSKCRKRRSEPDFLPSKKARLDTDEERQEVLRANNGNSCRQTETMSAVPANLAIPVC